MYCFFLIEKFKILRIRSKSLNKTKFSYFFYLRNSIRFWISLLNATPINSNVQKKCFCSEVAVFHWTVHVVRILSLFTRNVSKILSTNSKETIAWNTSFQFIIQSIWILLHLQLRFILTNQKKTLFFIWLLRWPYNYIEWNLKMINHISTFIAFCCLWFQNSTNFK